MFKCSKLLLLTNILFATASFAAIPNHDHPVTSLGPNLRAGFTGTLTDTSGYSFAGEAGKRNVRLSGTVGWNLFATHYLKLSGEYLWQRINFPFFYGNNYDWVNQGAIGATYQVDIDRCLSINPQFVFNVYYANAASANLGVITGTYNNGGVILPFIATNIGGSNTYGISPGFIIQPWHGAKAGIDVNYDNTRYNTKYLSHVSVAGFGGTAHFSQQLPQNLEVGVAAAMRAPYNNYEASIAWHSVPCYGAWRFKFIGDYTVGKKALPDTYNIGLAVDYFLDIVFIPTYTDYMKEQLMVWLAKPAAYVPQVLAIPDDQVIR